MIDPEHICRECKEPCETTVVGLFIHPACFEKRQHRLNPHGNSVDVNDPNLSEAHVNRLVREPIRKAKKRGGNPKVE